MADRVLVIDDGRISLDQSIPLARPRSTGPEAGRGGRQYPAAYPCRGARPVGPLIRAKPCARRGTASFLRHGCGHAGPPRGRPHAWIANRSVRARPAAPGIPACRGTRGGGRRPMPHPSAMSAHACRSTGRPWRCRHCGLRDCHRPPLDAWRRPAILRTTGPSSPICPDATVHDVAFTNATTGYAAGELGQVWATTDGGKSPGPKSSTAVFPIIITASR